MEYYNIANINVAMSCTGETTCRLAAPYRMDNYPVTGISIAIHEERLLQARQGYPHLSDDEWGYMQTGIAFSRSLPDFDGFCLHASAVAFDHRAVLFSAPCGTGKSTHTALWQQYFGRDRAVILNDDKPALRWIEDRFQVFGTPWSGKSGLNVNRQAPLHAIVFLEQGEENRVWRLPAVEAIRMLVYQSFRPSRDMHRMGRLLELFDVLLQETPVYRMSCTISEDAVRTVHHHLFGGEDSEG